MYVTYYLLLFFIETILNKQKTNIMYCDFFHLHIIIYLIFEY